MIERLGREPRLSGRRRRGIVWTGLIGSLSLLVLLGALGIAGCGDDKSGKPDDQPTGPRHPQDLLPPTGGSITRTGDLLLADTAQELQAAINGGYTLYVSYSFQEFAGQEYTAQVGAEQRVRIWIFRMDTTGNAQGLHNDENNQMGTPTDEYGEEARIDVSTATTIRFWRGVYWVFLTIDSANADAQTFLGLLATDIDTEIQSGK
ncbi:MAG: hypothetical protein FJY88_00420 [Candidatus Eisenbacteria bacterium]|nr:hypothetical protein [Candidatus Eisenbacteria bacterium]